MIARRWIAVVATALTIGLLVSAGSAPEPRLAIRTEIPSVMPPGANMYLGFADLRGDVQKLVDSALWQGFVLGDNHEAFIRSRLWLRFTERLTQMENLSGAALDGAGFGRLAASTCGLAFYDVGEIEFVYVGRAELETELLAALESMEGRFTSGKHSGVRYRIAREELLDMELAWAVADGYLMVSNREALLHTSLDLVDGTGPSLADDPGFHRVIDAMPVDGDQVVYLNLAALRDDGYFRTYWKQKQSLQDFEAFGATVSWQEGRAVEHRFLALEVPHAEPATAGDPTEALDLIPADALVAKSVTAASPGEAAAIFLDGGRGTEEPMDSFRTPLHDLLGAGDLTREQFDLLVGDRFAVGVLARPYDDTFTLLDRVVISRPTQPRTAEVTLRTVRQALPRRVTERLAGETRRTVPMVREEVLGYEVWTFDLYTGGIYAPSFALVDGWLVQANSVAGVKAVIQAHSMKLSLAASKTGMDTLQSSDGSVRQVLYLDLDASRETYESVMAAMEQGGTFRSWSAQEFWGERVRDLLAVLQSVHHVGSGSTHTEEGIVGRTVYLTQPRR